MAKFLLDTNLLLALAWPNHEFHGSAHRWWKQSSKKWATCVLTELAFIRLSSNPAFTSEAVTPYEAAMLLQRLFTLYEHEFWDRLPHLEAREFRDLTGHKQLNDFYLARLAILHRAKLATFDSRVRAIIKPENLELVPHQP